MNSFWGLEFNNGNWAKVLSLSLSYFFSGTLMFLFTAFKGKFSHEVLEFNFMNLELEICRTSVGTPVSVCLFFFFFVKQLPFVFIYLSMNWVSFFSFQVLFFLNLQQYSFCHFLSFSKSKFTLQFCFCYGLYIEINFVIGAMVSLV